MNADPCTAMVPVNAQNLRTIHIEKASNVLYAISNFTNFGKDPSLTTMFDPVDPKQRLPDLAHSTWLRASILPGILLHQ